MTAATSSKSKNYFGTRFKNNISSNKKIFIVNIVMELLGLPLLAGMYLISLYADELYFSNMNDKKTLELIDSLENISSTFAIIAVIALSISLLMGMVIALFQYSYLYRKMLTDMNYSLPLSGTQRFFSDFLSGITIYLAPFIGGVILATAILGAATPFFKDLSEFWEFYPYIMKLVAIVITAMLQYYTLTVLAISFCGNTFESIFTSLALNVMIPATIACLWFAITESSVYGISADGILLNSFFCNTTPIGAFFYFIAVFAEYYFEFADLMNETLIIRWIITTLIVTLIYIVISWFVCRIRKAEDVSKPYVYRTFFYLIMTMAVYCVLSLFIMSNTFIGGGILICGIGWFIMEVITRRGFKKFWQAGISFTASVLSVLLICGICDATDGFGASKRIPSSSIVSSVTIEINGSDNYIRDIRFHDKDVIKEAVKLNEELVARYFNYDNYEYNFSDDVDYDMFVDENISLTYTTITGSTICREYKAPSGMIGNLTKAIMLSDEYANQASIKLEEAMRNYQNGKIYYEFDINDKYCNYLSEAKPTEEMAKKLINAYFNDYKNMTEDDLINGNVYCYLTYRDIIVFDSFKETKAVLDELNISAEPELLKVETVGVIVDPVFFSNAYYYFNPDKSDYYKQDYTSYDKTTMDTLTQIDSREIYIDDNDNIKKIHLTNNSEAALKVIDRCTPIVFDEKPLAIFIINNHKYILLDNGDNKELLDSFLDSFYGGGKRGGGWDFTSFT